MVRKAFFLAIGSSAALLAAAPQAGAQRDAPRVRVTSQPHTSFGNIEPSVSLSEPAFILAVAIDHDGHVTVLSPAVPSDLIRFEAAKPLRLPEFFSGFSSPRTGYYGGYSPGYASYIRSVTEDHSTGSLLVLASKTPFNFAAISDGPFWNEDAIKKLVRYREPSSAVYALGRAVTAKGQSFGHDYLRFGARPYQVASADPCFGLGSAFGAGAYGYGGLAINGFGTGGYVIVAPTSASPGLQLISMGADACGRTRYVVVPISVLPPRKPASAPVDSAIDIPTPTLRSVIAATPGTYTGEEAVRVFETLKNRNTSDTYVGLPVSPVLMDKSDGRWATPVTHEGAPQGVESFERVKNATSTPVERAPVLRQAEPEQARPVAPQPVMRRDPVVRPAPAVQRASKPVEVVSTARDNQ